MCKYCKRITCENCILKWIEYKKICGDCMYQITEKNMISLPFLDDMCSFFINIPSNNKNIHMNNSGSFNKSDKKDENINKYKDICNVYGSKIEYNCQQCDQYFCSQCLLYYGKEVRKHYNHYIIKVKT